MSQTLEEEVNQPKHYRTHESGVEAIEITRWLIGDLSNAWKYAMRYEDKETPKKDILKCIWYLNDFHRSFINDNNECTVSLSLEYELEENILRVIESEPISQIKEVFRQIYSLYKCGGILFPAEWDKMIADLKVYAETLN